MNGMNRIEIIGNVVRDATLKTIDLNGVPTPVCNFSVAVDEESGEGKKIVTYFDVSCWRGRATSVAPWLMKGRKVLVSGPVRLNQYIDGNKNHKASIQISANTIVYLDKKPEVDVTDIDDFDADELPFG